MHALYVVSIITTPINNISNAVFSFIPLRAGAELSIFDIMQSWSISNVLRGWWEGVGLLVSLFWRGGEEVGGELRRRRWRLVHWRWRWR